MQRLEVRGTCEGSVARTRGRGAGQGSSTSVLSGATSSVRTSSKATLEDFTQFQAVARGGEVVLISGCSENRGEQGGRLRAGRLQRGLSTSTRRTRPSTDPCVAEPCQGTSQS